MEDQMGEPLACYPNPSSGEIHIRFGSEAMDVDEISIYDMLGRKVFCSLVHAAKDNTVVTIAPNLTAGVYILKVGGRALKIVRQ